MKQKQSGVLFQLEIRSDSRQTASYMVKMPKFTRHENDQVKNIYTIWVVILISEQPYLTTQQNCLCTFTEGVKVNIRINGGFQGDLGEPLLTDCKLIFASDSSSMHENCIRP